MSKTVFMIDDNEDDLLFTQIIFNRYAPDVALQQFTSAQSALSFFERSELSASALVLLDINMPGMGGFDFLDAYEQLPAAKRAAVVVVMLTSSADERDRQRALRYASVKAFSSKPLDRQSVADLLNFIPG